MSESKKAKVFHFDLYGKRDAKYNFLNDNSIASIAWKELEISEPNCFLWIKISEVTMHMKEVLK